TVAKSAWPHYSILTPERDKLARGLKDRGIPSAVYYPLPLHLHPAYERFGDGPGSLPVSEHLSNRILSLPLHAYMEDADVNAVCAAVREILG
ncbi:MAG: DegT/DnrJ/EryC1/StrS family aminotransferase, partial [Alphaproteobacteria bacterium]